MELADLLVDRWGLATELILPLDGGMNSRVWLVIAGGSKLVVKTVDLPNTSFGPGLAAAARLDAAGVTTGAPVVTSDGELFTLVGDHLFAVLRYVEGEPLTHAPKNQPAVGMTLARAHQILRTEPSDPAGWFDLAAQFGEYLDFEPWIRPAVEQAQYELAEIAGEHELTWAELHGDPAPEAFLAQPSGELALIDWGSSMTGPALYDVASTVMYFGAAAPEFSRRTSPFGRNRRLRWRSGCRCSCGSGGRLRRPTSRGAARPTYGQGWPRVRTATPPDWRTPGAASTVEAGFDRSARC